LFTCCVSQLHDAVVDQLGRRHTIAQALEFQPVAEAMLGLVMMATVVWILAYHRRMAFSIIFATMVPTLLWVPPPAINIGTISVNAIDGLALAAAAVAIGGIGARRSGLPMALVSLFALALLVLLLGIQQHTLPTAVNEFRPFFYFLSAAIYVGSSSQKVPDNFGLAVTVVFCAAVITLLAIYNWSRYGLRSNSGPILVGNDFRDPRAVNASAALVIMQAAITLLVAGGLRKKIPGRISISLIFIIMVVLLQHRTVWVIAIAALAIGFLLDPSIRGKRAGRGVIGLASGFLGATVIYILTVGSMGYDLPASVANMTGSGSTFQWRLTSWRLLLDQYHGTLGWVFGHPFGEGYARKLSGIMVTTTPHNFYVQTILRLGLIGLCLLIAVYAGLWRYTADIPWARVLLISQALYFVSYAPDMAQGAMLGMVISTVAQHQNVPKPELGDQSAAESNLGTVPASNTSDGTPVPPIDPVQTP
jgi:O-Antigen ligase